MNGNQARITSAAMGLTILLWLVSPLLGDRTYELQAPPPAQPVFDAANAWNIMREFVTASPRRVLGSFESRQATGFIQKRLRDLGYQVGYSHFDARIGGPKEVGRNVFGLKPGRTGEIVAILAHYDTAPATLQGAMDNGSGIGVLLELARVFATRDNRRGVLILATDGEEWGMLGASDFVETYGGRRSIVAALSIDCVAPGELARLAFEWSGQMDGYTPPWLRSLAGLAAAPEGLEIEEAYGARELVERALLISSTDQGPFLRMGVPALNLGSVSRDPARARAIYHSAFDTADNLQPASFLPVGRTAERIARGLDEMPAMPADGMGSFAPLRSRFLPPWLTGGLACLSFLPLALALHFHGSNHFTYLEGGRIRRQAAALLGTLLPLLLVYPAVRLLMVLRKLPRYSLYPATPKDPVLLNPPMPVLWGILATVLVTAALCFAIVRYFNRKLPRPDFFASKLFLLAMLSLVVLAALLYNMYWALAFLLLPVWIWSLLGPAGGAGGRAANCLLISAAAVPYLAVTCHFAGQLELGWKIVWYQLLALGTGLFTLPGFLLGAAAFALAIRFCAIQFEG